MSVSDYSVDELMVCLMSREMRDGEVVVQGFSTPLVFTAFVLAKRTHAPHLYFMYTVGNSLADLPGQVGISFIERLTLGACLKQVSLTEINCDLAPHFRPREFMRPAQVDARGNFNNTVIGSYERPKVRLPGGAGIPDATNFNDHLNLYVPRHTTKAMVEKVDFRTGLGYGDPAADRSGLPVIQQGPNLLVTELCVFDFEDGWARLRSLHPGVNLNEVRRRTSFSFRIPEKVKTTDPPSPREIKLIREEIDPLGVRCLEFLSGPERLEAIEKILALEEKEGGPFCIRT
jgi:acyl CoA:acetate/3-ketoacid CoA transferase beta subunit